MLTTTFMPAILTASLLAATHLSASLPAAVTQAAVTQGVATAIEAKAEGLAVGKSAQGTLILNNGDRLQGMVHKTRKGWAIKKHGKRRSFSADEVQQFLSRSELLKTFERLAARTDPKQIFAQAQLTLWAFENGLSNKAWPLLGQLYASNKKVPGLDKIEDLAARSFLAEFSARQKLDTKAQRILLEANDIKGNPVRQAKNQITPHTLARLLVMEREALQAKGDSPKKVSGKRSQKLSKYAKSFARSFKSKKAAEGTKVESLLRVYAEEALSTHRRKLARRALLADRTANQTFVYRLAVRFPNGPNRHDILRELFAQNLVDDAATYLSGQMARATSLEVLTRTTEVLGDLGSPIALPALRNTKKALASGAIKRKKGSGGGGSRAYISNITQIAYISDFNVEVAQAAFIADPIVNIIQAGTVLDAKVIGVDWTRYIVRLGSRLDRAIKKITNKAAQKR
jgi:hypothetical protein